MSEFVASFGAPELVAVLLFIMLNAYVLMGGADFGGGLWDLLATGPRRDAQRSLVASAIGPIWEANHVWLIIVVVMLFTAFPPAFAMLTTVLHVPLSLMLVGIVMRGSAFVFRSYGGQDALARDRWGRTFAIASATTPVLLGMIAGALFTGAVGDASAKVGHPSFIEVFVTPWLTPFPIVIGLLTLTLFAQLAATYLTIATDDATLRDDFRQRAIGAGAFAIGLGAIAAALIHEPAGVRQAVLLSGPRSWLWLGATAFAAIAAIVALARRRFPLARVAVCVEVSLIVWGWAAAQYPYLVPRAITIRGGAAPASTLDELLIALVIGAVLLVPSLAYLLKTFAAHGAAEQASHSPDI